MASPSLTLISLMTPALGESTGISIFIDSRIMISPSASILSPGLVWIFQTLPAISDFTLTTAIPWFSPRRCSHGFFGHATRQRKGRAAHTAAEPVCGFVHGGKHALGERRAAIADLCRQRCHRGAGNPGIVEDGQAGGTRPIGAEACVVVEHQGRLHGRDNLTRRFSPMTAGGHDLVAVLVRDQRRRIDADDPASAGFGLEYRA